MAGPRVVAVRAATDRALLALLVCALWPGSLARAQADDWTFERFGYRFGLFEQDGRGIQSRAGLDSSMPGRESVWVFQNILDFRVRQDRDAVHSVAIPVDVVSAASTDALDAVSTASRETEAATVDWLSSVRDGPRTTYQVRLRPHVEEHWLSFGAGGAVAHSFAEDNATFTAGFELRMDNFQEIGPAGHYTGDYDGVRVAASVNTGISQLLSPTTIVSAGYSFTAQFGVLETTYNSIPYGQGSRIAERLPRTRGRHALSGELRQAIMETHTFLSADYRFYVDSFGAWAHTARGVVTQELGDLWIRAHYRFHYQDAVDFWMPTVPADFPTWRPRTADSDLATFHAQEISVNVRWFFERRGALTFRSSFLQVGYLYYWRSNDLRTHLATVELGLGFQ